MTVIGTVYKIKKGAAIVRCARPESCSHCENSAICEKKNTELHAYDTLGAKEGDIVEVETREDGKNMLVVSYIFLVPIIIIFFSYFLYTINAKLTFSAILFAAAYFIGLKILNKKYDPQVKITRIIEHKTEEPTE